MSEVTVACSVGVVQAQMSIDDIKYSPDLIDDICTQTARLLQKAINEAREAGFIDSRTEEDEEETDGE